MSQPAPTPKFRGVDTTTGLALVGGKLYTYSAGTSTPKNSYTDSTLGVANANPTILDSRGEANVWLDGSYKFVLKDSADATIWTVDNIQDATNGATFTNTTFTGTSTFVNLTVTGNTQLGDAAADTLSVSGSALKNSTGNWTFAAPSSGTTGTFNAVAGASALDIQEAAVAKMRWLIGASERAFLQYTSATDILRLDSDGGFELAVNNAVKASWNSAGNATFAAPSSGITVTTNAVAGANAIVQLYNVASATSENLVSFQLNSVTKGVIGSIGTAGNMTAGSVQNDFVIRNASNILFTADAGTTTHYKISTAGNHTFAAPTSGVGFTQTGFAGSNAANFNGGTSGTFSVTTTGGATTNENIRANGASSTIGFSTGAGGTVTQATNKTTGVTLNKTCGQITMNAAALAANAVVQMTLTNSLIAATDVILANVSSGFAATGSYAVQCESHAAGSVAFSVRNVTAGSLSEAIVINFIVLKTVTS